jgi:hypothetical protein
MSEQCRKDLKGRWSCADIAEDYQSTLRTVGAWWRLGESVARLVLLLVADRS